MEIKKNTWNDLRIEAKNNNGKMEWSFEITGTGTGCFWIIDKRKDSIKTIEQAFEFFMKRLKQGLNECDKKENSSSNYHHLIKTVFKEE